MFKNVTLYILNRSSSEELYKMEIFTFIMYLKMKDHF